MTSYYNKLQGVQVWLTKADCNREPSVRIKSYKMQQKTSWQAKTLFKRMTVSEISFLSYSKAPKCTCPNSLAGITCAMTRRSRNDTCQVLFILWVPVDGIKASSWDRFSVPGCRPLRAQAFRAPCTLCFCQHLQVLSVLITYVSLPWPFPPLFYSGCLQINQYFFYKCLCCFDCWECLHTSLKYCPSNSVPGTAF